MQQQPGTEITTPIGQQATTDREATVDLGRGWRVGVRVLALLGLLTFSFMLLFVVSDAAKRVGVEQVLEEPESAEARVGAEHPGEAVHLTGTLAALAIGVAGFGGLVTRPQRAGSANHAAAIAIGMLVAIVVVGDPDNHGGQAGAVDPAFLIMALPPFAAVLAARPWRTWRPDGVERPQYLLLAGLALPALWYGAGQALMQRNTWPPLADPHHQAHWYAMAVLTFVAVFVVATAALSGKGWRIAAVTPGLAAISVAVASFLAPDAASALAPAWAGAALLWGLAVLGATWAEVRRT